MRRRWRAVVALALARADEVRFAADLRSWWHSDVAPTFETLEAAAAAHLRPADAAAFERATGSSVAAMLRGARDAARAAGGGDPLPGASAPVVMSTKKVVPHPLNARGFHAFRALVATRIQHSILAQATGADDWRRRLLRDGYVAHPFEGLDAQGRLPAAIAAKFEALFRRNFSTATAGGWERAVTAPNDKQHYLHVDTYLPTYKAWIFLNVTVEDGPFAYVRGSHHASVPKLRWLFERTRHLTSTRAMPRASPNFYAARGPFVEETFGYEASLRFAGADPDDAAATAAALRAAGFVERPTLLTGSRALAVIADTSGLHARARQAPGRVRTQILPPIPLLPRLPPTDPLPKLAGEAVGGGRNCAPRRNVFHCASHTLQCALP